MILTGRLSIHTSFCHGEITARAIGYGETAFVSFNEIFQIAATTTRNRTHYMSKRNDLILTERNSLERILVSEA